MLSRFFKSWLYCLLSVPALANPLDNIQVSGFVGVGGATTSANGFLGSRKSIHLIEAGLRGSANLPYNLSFTGQLVYLDFGELFEGNGVRLDFASLNWHNNALGVGEQEISLGRIKVPMGIYNQSRDMPFSRPSIMLPQSVYMDMLRNMMITVDGVYLGSTHQVGLGTLRVSAGGGALHFDDSFNQVALAPGVQGRWQEDDAWFIDARIERPNLQFALSYASIEPRYQAAMGDVWPPYLAGVELPVIDGQFSMDSTVASAQYWQGSWELTSEVAVRTMTARGFNPFDQLTKRRMVGLYLQGRYHLSTTLTLLMRWERFFRNSLDRDGELFKQRGAPTWLGHTMTQAVGLQWQPAARWMLAVEVHNINGSGWLPPLSHHTPSSAEKRDWHLGLAQLSYRF